MLELTTLTAIRRADLGVCKDPSRMLRLSLRISCQNEDGRGGYRLEATTLVGVGNYKGNIHIFNLSNESDPAICTSSSLFGREGVSDVPKGKSDTSWGFRLGAYVDLPDHQ
jgi:hypothetical protein